MHERYEMALDILRDKRMTTKMLILLELTSNGPVKFRALAEKLDITVQGVSDYFKIMRKEKLVRKVGGDYKATRKGIKLLHEKFNEIREFVVVEMNRLKIIDLCTALAGGKIRTGDRVGLFMEDGRLVAYRNRKSGSSGVAITDAEKGQDVGIKELDGIVDMKVGGLHILQVPDIRDGGSKGVSQKKLKKLLGKIEPDRIAVLGATAFKTAQLANVRADIEFAALEGSIEACKRGLDVAVFIEGNRVHEIVSMVEEFNRSSEDKIKYDLVQLEDVAGA